MAPQFQRPEFLTQQPTKTEALVNPISQTIQTLPELYAAYKMRRKQQDIEQAKLDMEQKKYTSQYGTGVDESIRPGQVISAPPATAGPEEQMFDFEATMPVLGQETAEQQLRRQGTEGFNAQTQRLKAEQERPTRSQLKVTDKNVPVLFDPTSNTLVVQSTGEEYNPAVHGNIVVPGAPPVLPPNQNVEITDITAARKQLRDLVAGAKASGFGTGNPLVEKARTNKLNPLQYFDPKAQKFKQLTAATKQIIGKGLEGGVLRKEDEDKYEAIIPQPGDSTDILESKARQLDALLEQKQNERIKGFEPTFRGVPQGESLTPIGGGEMSFASEADVPTDLPPGTVVVIGGRRAVIE